MFERIFYSDPFANIVFTVRISTKLELSKFKKTVYNVVNEVLSLNKKFLLDDSGKIMFNDILNTKNIYNKMVDINTSNNDEIEVVSSLMKKAFNLQQGDVFRIILCEEVESTLICFAIHHLVADARSFLLLIKKILCNLDGVHSDVLEEHICEDNYESVELSNREKFLLSTINNKKWNNQYFYDKYEKLIENIYSENRLCINKEIVQSQQLKSILTYCKKNHISLTSYISSELFIKKQFECIVIPVDHRPSVNAFGNFISRIEISNDMLRNKKNNLEVCRTINQKISNCKESEEWKRTEMLFRKINPLFFDELSFKIYSDNCPGDIQRFANVLNIKSRKRTMGVISNIGAVSLPKFSNFSVKDIVFYPPPALECKKIYGLVTYNENLYISTQNYT